MQFAARHRERSRPWNAVPGCISAHAKLLDARIFKMEAIMSTTARFPGSPRDI
jgi:hypothetical protein